MSDGWWRDDWGEWHGPARDMSNAAPHEPRPAQLPPHLRQDPVPEPFRQAFAEAEPPTDTTPAPIVPLEAVSDAPGPFSRYAERPGFGPPPPDPVTGLRLLARLHRSMFKRTEGDEP